MEVIAPGFIWAKWQTEGQRRIYPCPESAPTSFLSASALIHCYKWRTLQAGDPAHLWSGNAEGQTWQHMWTWWYTRRHKIGSPWFLKEHCLTTKLWAVMCVAQTQLSQCCCLPDEPLNHPQLLKYHGNFCKCRNAQCNPVARFQLTKLHPPCSFTFLPSDALLPSNSAHQAAAMPRTLWALQSQALPDHW